MDLPNPGIKPRSPTLQVDSLLAEPQEKPKNTGVGSLSLLQGIFLTQELNQGLLHCRQIPLIAQLVKNPPAKGGDSNTCFHQPLRVSKCGCRWMQQASKLSAAPELAAPGSSSLSTQPRRMDWGHSWQLKRSHTVLSVKSYPHKKRIKPMVLRTSALAFTLEDAQLRVPVGLHCG